MKKLKIIATNGKKDICLAWIRIGSNIYGSITHHRVKMHRSYHHDGTSHWKRESSAESVGDSGKFFKDTGYSRITSKGQPLDRLKKAFDFLQAGMRLDQNCFDAGVEHDRKKIDKTICIDSRVIKGKQKHVNFYIELIKAGSYYSLGNAMETKRKIASKESMAADFYCYLEFCPWILVSTLYRN